MRQINVDHSATGNRLPWTVRYLGPKTIIKVQFFTHLRHVPVFWEQGNGKIAQLR
jgi:hypothetical protein